MTRILIHNDETEALARRLKAAQPKVEIGACRSYDGMEDALRAFRPHIVYTVRFAGTPGFPRDSLFGENGPEWIANGGVGTDHFGQWNPETTTVTNAAGVAADMMAEYIMGGFLHFTLDVPGLLRDKTDRAWRARQVVPLKGKTLLVIGLGHTGRALAKRAKAFGMQVVGTRANPQRTDHVDRVEPASALHDLLPLADAIALCTPLTDATKHLVSTPEITLMKKGVLFADVSRGGVTDQTALAEALTSNHIKGAALDVFESEPLPGDSPLWSLPNALVSPHCASVYDGWETASFDMFLANLDAWINGAPLTNIVNPNRGY